MPRVVIPEETVQKAIEESFQCGRCGNCCKGDGVVSIARDEVARMAKYLGLSEKEFLKKYTIRVQPGQWWLVDQANAEQWCIFLERDDSGLYGCKVNPAKPDQCRSFPARWRNEDSFKSCLGLRNLMKNLRERMSGYADSATAASGSPASSEAHGSHEEP